MFKRSNSEYSRGERILTSVLAFIIFGFVGLIVRLFWAPVVLESISGIIMQFVPFGLGLGSVSAALAYIYPKPFQILMCFMPGIGGPGN